MFNNSRDYNKKTFWGQISRPSLASVSKRGKCFEGNKKCVRTDSHLTKANGDISTCFQLNCTSSCLDELNLLDFCSLRRGYTAKIQSADNQKHIELKQSRSTWISEEWTFIRCVDEQKKDIHNHTTSFDWLECARNNETQEEKYGL